MKNMEKVPKVGYLGDLTLLKILYQDTYAYVSKYVFYRIINMLSKIPQVDFLCKVSTKFHFKQSKLVKLNEKTMTTVQKHPVLCFWNRNSEAKFFMNLRLFGEGKNF